MCKFSLLTVCLNPGDKLRMTIESALSQTCGDFELIIKDGGSQDGSLEGVSRLLEDPRIRVITRKDTGIYDAMNQAVGEARGEYIFFLNCGDVFYDERVLEQVKRASEEPDRGASETPWILYGDVFSVKNQAMITSPPDITGFTCYRNVPCHQACFYSTALCREKPFETKYRIRGDYEHFLWCFYRGGARLHYLGIPVAQYEGGGYSETKENLKRSKREHREITERYMKKGELFKYRMIMAVTLAPLRTRLAESRHFSGLYNGLIGLLYKKGK